ncbi:hypothetical protein RSPO_m01395 (plasmid) [Ralstonia solanacearum Po82]|uniref:Uncharacterized protein n=1 Tax=Ralstonia solanacearum (strain Po82) TaxID=1031711 RepID=F6GBG4_RALS8|nr:hypothetical protein RSPO_m01395 [Ralstonia solanacearum Po82]
MRSTRRPSRSGRRSGPQSLIALQAPRKPKSTVLPTEDEAIIVAFRQRTLLPLEAGKLYE